MFRSAFFCYTDSSAAAGAGARSVTGSRSTTGTWTGPDLRGAHRHTPALGESEQQRRLQRLFGYDVSLLHLVLAADEGEQVFQFEVIWFISRYVEKCFCADFDVFFVCDLRRIMSFFKYDAILSRDLRRKSRWSKCDVFGSVFLRLFYTSCQKQRIVQNIFASKNAIAKKSA